MSKLWKNIGWGALKLGAGLTGGVFGGPLGGMGAVATVDAAQLVVDKDKQKQWRKKPGTAVLETGLDIGGGALAGAGGAKIATKTGVGIGKNAGMATTSRIVSNSASGAVHRGLITTGDASKGLISGGVANSTANNVVTGTAGKEMGKIITKESANNVIKTASTDVSKQLARDATKKVLLEGGKETVKKEGMSKLTKGLIYANIGKAALDVGLSIKGIHDLKNMKAPSVAPPPMVKPEYTPDTVSSTQAAESENIETALANKKKTDLATGRSDSSEDAILEMTAQNKLAATIEQGRTARNQTINDNQFRADMTNQGMIANVNAANANMSANFEAMRGGMESELLNTAMNAPFSVTQAILGNRVTESNRKDDLINALATAQPKEREYIVAELKKLGYNA